MALDGLRSSAAYKLIYARRGILFRLQRTLQVVEVPILGRNAQRSKEFKMERAGAKPHIFGRIMQSVDIHYPADSL